MRILPHTSSCFVCGESNPIGLKLQFETDDTIVRARFTPGSAHVGFKQTIHGGITATLLDEIMVWACAIRTKRFAYCAELNIRYLGPLHPNEEVQATGELITNKKNKLFEARGEIRSQSGLLLAVGTGKYLPIKDEDMRGIFTDFVGDIKGLFDPAA